MIRVFAILGALSAALAIAAGAFGAHALRERLEPRLLDVFETAARYQVYHALALIAVAWVVSRLEAPSTPASASFALAAGWFFVGGTVVFSGSLYALALTGIRAFGAITPLGGACFIAGWLCLAMAAVRMAP